MKFALIVITFFVAKVAFADSAKTYQCTSASGKIGALKIVDGRFSEPQLEFYPDVKSKEVYKSSFSNLGDSQIPFFSQYLVIEDTDFKGLNKKIVNDVLVEPQVLHGGSPLRVVLAIRDVNFLGQMRSMEIKSYNCAAE